MNFIIYEDDVNYVKNYKAVIDKFMINSKLDYNTIILNKYDENKINHILNNLSNKIFLLDVEVPGKNGIDLARMIRNNGDWSSPIIIITSHEEYKLVGYTGKILMLDFISKADDLLKILKEDIDIAYLITNNKPSFDFVNKGEYYKLPYEDILYFEKSLNDNDSVIITKDDEYVVRKSITELESILDGKYFVKTHRSCIVNKRNITEVNYEECIIYFGTFSINLLSRRFKKILKEQLNDICS